jgi:hypothetical protein
MNRRYIMLYFIIYLVLFFVLPRNDVVTVVLTGLLCLSILSMPPEIQVVEVEQGNATVEETDKERKARINAEKQKEQQRRNAELAAIYKAFAEGVVTAINLNHETMDRDKLPLISWLEHSQGTRNGVIHLGIERERGDGNIYQYPFYRVDNGKVTSLLGKRKKPITQTPIPPSAPEEYDMVEYDEPPMYNDDGEYQPPYEVQ